MSLQIQTDFKHIGFIQEFIEIQGTLDTYTAPVSIFNSKSSELRFTQSLHDITLLLSQAATRVV